VLADEAGRGPAAAAPRLRLRWLAAVVAIMAMLTAGWPLLDSTVANRQPLAAGAKVTVGSGPRTSGTVTVGPGWYVQSAQSNPLHQYVLSQDGVVLVIRPVSLVGSRQVTFVWLGMRQILSVTNPGTELSEPVITRTDHGMRALTGRISGLGLIGMVTIVLSPSKAFAIGMVILATRGTSRELLESAHRTVLSLVFSPPTR
jgi:hypothetical protein